MTKKLEIAILKDCAEKLGPNSYCGPWLEGVISEIEKEIQSDLMPSPSIWQTHKENELSLEITRQRCVEMIKSAQKEHDKIIDGANNRADAIKGYVRYHLQEISKDAFLR